MNIKIFKNIDEISQELTSKLYRLANMDGKNKINIALSGGSTPIKFYKYLTQSKRHINWDKIHLFWGDERCVPPDHEESNYGQAYQSLISKIDIPADNIHRIRGEADPVQEVQRYQTEIRQNVPVNKNGWPQFDWILLGMGDDGHTASIFPDTPAARDFGSLCLTAEHPQTGQKRVSIGLNVINHARRVSFLITGESKAYLIAKILNMESDVTNLPAAKIKLASGELEWFLDADAASLVTHPNTPPSLE
jgi:6-phosphogluconolactonase